MRYFRKAALMAAALAVSACASAGMDGPQHHGTESGSMPAGDEARQGMRGAMMGMMTPLVGCRDARGDVEARLASLRAVLHITPAQESAWNAYAAAFRTHAERMGAGMMDMGAGADGAAPPSVVDRLRQHEAMMSQHMATFQTLRAAIEPLYASFSAEQRAAADALRCDPPS